MKSLLIRLLPFSLLALATVGVAAVPNPVDYETFLSRFDLTWKSVPKDHGSSAFIGNGLMGATIWSKGDEVLHWHLGRNDVYDTAPGIKHRMSIGKLVLQLKVPCRTPTTTSASWSGT